MNSTLLFQSARSILENKESNLTNILVNKEENKVESELQNQIEYYKSKGTVKNTLKVTRNWVAQLEPFCKSRGYNNPIETITDIRVLQRQIVEFITLMKQQNGQEYKANSLKLSLDAINHHLLKSSKIPEINLHNRYEFPEIHDVLHGKMRYLQEKGLGEVQSACALNLEQVKYILEHEFMIVLTPENLLYRQREDNGFNFIRYVAKNNQRDLNGGNAQIIPIPADHLDTCGSCYDFQLYLSKHPINADEHLYLQVNPKWKETSIWYKTTRYGLNQLNKFIKKIDQRTKISIPTNLLSNHSGRKTATQILHDNEIPEQTIMNITGHRSIQGVWTYKLTNKQQKLMGISSLISLYESNSNNLSHEN
ncbi:9256_t:CDS:2 [Ambispora gerdemannii]|uniref:9256_t:CDS:1 n=1 Tax=Ambispora gerdemannii TaxID=144530 RepID=A0A9N9FEN4_9GLOM|nr:9256_t:CDS:2 [Ambispora gerdemannii]